MKIQHLISTIKKQNKFTSFYTRGLSRLHLEYCQSQYLYDILFFIWPKITCDWWVCVLMQTKRPTLWQTLKYMCLCICYYYHKYFETISIWLSLNTAKKCDKFHTNWHTQSELLFKTPSTPNINTYSIKKRGRRQTKY